MAAGRGRRARATIAVVAGLLLAGGLVGCRETPTGDEAGPADLQELAVPEHGRPAAPVVADLSLVAETDDLPWAVVGRETAPGGGSRAVVWLADGRGTFPEDPATLGVAGEVRALHAAGDGTATVVAGTTWRDGTTRPFLLRSQDRRSWVEVRLPSVAAEIRPDRSAVVAGAAVVLGVVPGEDQVLGVRVPRDGEPAAIRLPEGEGTPTVTGVAGSGAVLVVAVAWDRGPGDPVTVTYRSTDQGRSWRESAVPGTGVDVAGVGTTRDGFVLTGSVRAGSGDEPRSLPAIWYWTIGDDGWTTFEMTFTGAVDRSVEFGAPAAGGDRLATVMHGDDIQFASLAVGDSDSLSTLGAAPESDGVGHSGPSAWSTDGTTVRAVLAGDGGARVVEVDVASEEWSVVSTLAPTQRWSSPGAARHPDGRTVSFARTDFVDIGEGWRTEVEQHVLVPDLDAAALVVSDDDLPEEVPEDWSVRHAVAPDGAELVLASGWTPDRSRVAATTFHRADADAVWAPAVPLDDAAYVGAYDVRWVADGEGTGAWVVAGQVSVEDDVESARRAVVWSSREGRAWQDAGTLPDGATGAAGKICLLPGGEPMVLGEVVDGSRWADVAWVRTGDGWATTELDPDDAHEVVGCVDGSPERDALVQVDVDGRTELRATRDGVSLETVASTEEGESWSPVVAVAGGFATVGHVLGSGAERTVLRFSTDGATWQHRELPVAVPGSGSVHPVGEGAVVTVSGPGGVQAWYLPSVAAYVETDDPPAE